MNEVPGPRWGPQAKALASTLHDRPHSELAVTTGPPDSDTRHAWRSPCKKKQIDRTPLAKQERAENKTGGGKGSHSLTVTVF